MAKKKQQTKAVTKRKQQPKKEKLSLVPSPIKDNQLMWMVQKTPPQHIHKRVAKGGGTWNYVTGAYVRQVLNYVFGWMWDFEIKNHGREDNHIWVLGRLVVKDKADNQIIKEQFGRAEVKFKRGSKEPLDFGNDLKAAATDAMKKCASAFGIASDVYNENEFAMIQKEDKGFVPPQNDKSVPPQVEVIDPKNDKLAELKKILKGATDEQKLADLKKRTKIILQSFRITQKHASILIASLLNSEVSKKE